MKKFISVLMAAMLMVTAAVPVTAMAAPAEPAAASLIAPAPEAKEAAKETTASDEAAAPAENSSDSAAAENTVPATGGITPEQAVQQAYALYVLSGLDQKISLERVQAKIEQIVADPAGFSALVDADLKALKQAVEENKQNLPAPVASILAEELTPEQIAQQAFALFVQAGLDQSAAFEHVKARLEEIVANPDKTAEIVKAEMDAIVAKKAEALKNAAQAGTEQAATDQAGPDQAGTEKEGTGQAGTGQAETQQATDLTPQKIVEKALLLFVQAGVEPSEALKRVQAKAAEMIAHPENIESIVKEEISRLSGTDVTALTPEQIVQQAFAKCVESGMTTEEAMASVQANLAALLGMSE